MWGHDAKIIQIGVIPTGGSPGRGKAKDPQDRRQDLGPTSVCTDISSMRFGPGDGVAASALSGAAFHSLMRPVSPVAGLSRRAETSWDTKAVDPNAAPAWRRCTIGCSRSATSGS